MAITTFTELKAAILDYSTRSELTDVDDDFVLLTEARLNYGAEDSVFPTPRLRVRQMQQRATASLPSGQEFLALPTDHLETIDLQINTSPVRDVRYITPGDFDIKFDNSVSGVPTHFTIIGEEFRFHPLPADTYTVEQIYYKKIPDLATNSTNWLLDAYPNVYLYGGLLELAIYINEDADIEKYGRLFSGSLRGLERSGKASQYAGPLRATTDVKPGSTSVVRA